MADVTLEELAEKISSLEARLSNIEAWVAQVETRLRQIEAKSMAPQKRRIGITVEELKAELDEPFKRSPEAIKRALSIVGIGDNGVDDLATNLHEYLYGDKRER